MKTETPKSAIPKDIFTKLYEPHNYELDPPITPPGPRISKALASELSVVADDSSIAND